MSNSPQLYPAIYSYFLQGLSSVCELLKEGTDPNTSLQFYLENAHRLESGIKFEAADGIFDEGLIGMLVTGDFRDMDFVFDDPNDGYSSGRQLFIEMVRLAYRWEALNAIQENNESISRFSPTEVANLPIFTGEIAQNPKPTDSVTHRIMKEPTPESSTLSTRQVVGFEDLQEGKLQMFFQGPEQLSGTCEFTSKIIELIKKAQKKIVINHMYFAPTDEIIQALIEAVEQRGVQIEIITCANTMNCPNNHQLFGPFNKSNWVKLANSLSLNSRKNLKVFLYAQYKKGFHKKVFIFDDKIVLAGSSNLGYKSLVSASDHEINFVAESEELAKRTVAICEIDKKLSEEVADHTEISYTDRLIAQIYSAAQPLVN